MPVMPTQEWLLEMVAACKASNGKSIENIQCEAICKPLMNVFPNAYPEEIQCELWRNGLFEPQEWVRFEQTLEEMKVWEIVREEFQRLQGKWCGPDIPIYIFPITKVEAVAYKNGVAYKDAVFLFISEELAEDEIRALFAHEYHHVCRMKTLHLVPENMTLKDSLILEGLAEYAVEELYGSKWLAPWLKLYSMEEMLLSWREHFQPFLDLRGAHHHFAFLYGGQLPKWMGYCIGYAIVQSYQYNGADPQLHKKSAEAILMGSSFPLQ